MRVVREQHMKNKRCIVCYHGVYLTRQIEQSGNRIQSNKISAGMNATAHTVYNDQRDDTHYRRRGPTLTLLCDPGWIV